MRFWWNRFGPMFATEIRRKQVDRMRAFIHWRWRLDEVYVKINVVQHYLWRAVDHEGEVLESYVTKTRDKAAAPPWPSGGRSRDSYAWGRGGCALAETGCGWTDSTHRILT